MAKTLEKLRFELLDIINQYSDDFEADYRLLDELIMNKRVKWFEQVFNKFNNTVPSVYYQSISCVPMELVSTTDCCEELTGCYVLRSVDQMPQVMSLSDGEMIAKVAPVGIDARSYDIISQFRIPYWGNGKYNKTAIAATYINDYLYLFSKDTVLYPQIEKISFRAVFRDPKAAGRFTTCEGGPCWSEEDPYPIEERLWEYMKTDILNNDFKMKLGIPRDNVNDNQQNSTDNNQGSGNQKG